MSWIKCSERMPEEHQNVLVSAPGKNSRVAYAKYNPGSPAGCWDFDTAHGSAEQWSVWQPLPEPPESDR